MPRRVTWFDQSPKKKPKTSFLCFSRHLDDALLLAYHEPPNPKQHQPKPKINQQRALIFPRFIVHPSVLTDQAFISSLLATLTPTSSLTASTKTPSSPSSRQTSPNSMETLDPLRRSSFAPSPISPTIDPFLDPNVYLKEIVNPINRQLYETLKCFTKTRPQKIEKHQKMKQAAKLVQSALEFFQTNGKKFDSAVSTSPRSK